MVGGDLPNLLVLPREPAEALHRLRDGAEPAGLYRQGLGHRGYRRRDLAVQPLGDIVHRRLIVQALQGAADLGGHGRSLLKRLLGGAVGVDVLQRGAVVPHQGLNDLPLCEPDLPPSSSTAFLIFMATRLQNIVARSSRPPASSPCASGTRSARPT